MLSKIAITRLYNTDFLGYGTDIIAICKKFNLPLPALTAATASFETSITGLKAVYAQEKGSILSPQVEQADLRRDNAVSGIKLTCEAHSRHFEPAKVAAADTILRCIAKYSNNIAKENYLRETEMLRNLSEDFDAAGTVKDALALVGLTAWAGEMKAANEQFNTVYTSRITEASQKPDGTVTDLRLPAREQYDALMKVITALDTLTPGDGLTNMIKEINVLTDKYSLVIPKPGKKGGEEIPIPAP